MNTETHYHEDTPERVKQILESARYNHSRIRVFYGDSETGRDWGEEYDVMGRVGRSTGTKPIPLLIHNSRSLGGGGILDHRIVKITRNKRVLYEHQNYHHANYEIVESDMHGIAEIVLEDGKVCARFSKNGQAQKWIDFMEGKRNSK